MRALLNNRGLPLPFPADMPVHASPLHRPLASMMRLGLVLALCGLTGAPALAATPAATATATEASAAQALQQARQQGPLALRQFLLAMPKGADLHMHLTGAVYAESFMAQAAGDQLCVDSAKLMLVDPQADAKPACATPNVDADQALHNQNLYDAMIDAMSMRAFVPTPGHNGHDQFFATFDHAHALTFSSKHAGDWIAEVTERAAAQNEQYLELMYTPPFAHAAALAHRLGWQDDFAAMRRQLLANGLKDELPADREVIAQALAQRAQSQHCDDSHAAAPGCAVQVRMLYQVLRGAAPEQVFAQTLLGFEVASSDPNWVGINFVMAEDGYLSMRDYSLQMRMLDYLHQQYPKVHISLHAGELAPGLVPPEGLRFHIRQAVELGHAERIGHGVDVMYEDQPQQLLKEMAARHTLVEINLTSNDVILGIKGQDHPLPFYLRYGVPVALSTDDEGVSRIDLTHEYVRAVQEFNLDYPTLKQMVRNSLTYSFLPGASLWSNDGQLAASCTGQALGANRPGAACQSFLRGSAKATAQWELEHRFDVFEAAPPALN
jgi:adenosine deaminase